jgi:hypothetical protein
MTARSYSHHSEFHHHYQYNTKNQALHSFNSKKPGGNRESRVGGVTRYWLSLAVLYLLMSPTAALPVTGCTGVSTNTGSGFPTTLPALAPDVLSISETLPNGSGELKVFITTHNTNTKVIRFYSITGAKLLDSTLTCAGINFKSVILKDPLKLFVAQWNDRKTASYSVTILSGVYSLTLLWDNINAPEKYGVLLSEEGTNYLWLQDMVANKIHKGVTTWGAGSFVTYNTVAAGGQDTQNAIYMAITYDSSKFFVGGGKYFGLYNKADFTQVKVFDHSLSPSTEHWAMVLDNLATYRTYSCLSKGAGPDPQCFIFNLALATDPPTVTFVDGHYGLDTNNILNFGPYQYVVTIKKGPGVTDLLFLSKINLSSDLISLPSSVEVGLDRPSFQGFVETGSRFYFSIVEGSTNQNFQSYYLTVDRCAVRDGSNVCTDCVDGLGLYRVGTAPNNLCMTTAEFPAGYGIDTSQSELANLCFQGNCAKCLSDNLICTECNIGWYLKSGACYHPTSAPIIPDFFGANTVTKTADACQDTHCKLCKATYATCIGCDTGSSWYLDGTTCKHATLSPVFSAGTGPNTGTGMVVTCQDANCATCSATHVTCTVCSAGWYLRTGSCYHPTVAPTIPDFFGANSVTGTADACQETHCKFCKMDYTTCIGCDTGAGWYLDGSTCKHATLSPVFPASKGPNTGTGLVVTCNEANCLTCSSTYWTCTACIAGWYFRTGSCYHPTSAPIIPDYFGANTVTGTADSCQDVHCKLCKATYSTCTGCDIGSSWYLDSNTCKHATLSPVFTSSTGPNTVSGLVVPCQDSNCATCSATYLTCTQCNAGWYLKIGACYHPTLSPIIADYFGANTVTGNVVPCQDTQCKLCKTNYLTCNECDNGSGWYLDATTCKHATLSPVFSAGTGPNVGTGLVVPCQELNCQICSGSHSTCTQCTPGWYFKTGSCYHPTSAPIIPDYFGANTVTGTADSCQDTHCKLCKATYLTCTGCDTVSNWYLDGTTCRHATLSPVFTTSTGPNTGTGMVVPCQDANCATCSATHVTCTVCSAGWYLKTGACYHPTLAPIIPDYFGANTLTGTADSCQDTHCKLCKATYATCIGCDTGSSWYLDGTTCKHATLSPVFSAGTGPNTGTGMVVPCQDANCATCSATHVTCTVCSAGWYLKSGACYHPTLTPIIPDYFGANTVTGTADGCQDSHCKLCKATYSTCTECDIGWYLKTGACYHPTSAPIIPDYFGANTVTGIADGCQDTHCKLCKATYATCTGCDTGSSWYLDSNTCKHATLSPVFATSTGPNTGSGLVVPCQDANCAVCSTTYTTCTQCNSGWYVKTGTCYHPTLAPTIPDYFGANTLTGNADACQDSHCRLCKTAYTNCIGCDTGSGWYLDGNTCKHATLSPVFTSGKGPNTATGLLVSCVTSHCTICAISYVNCQTCEVGYLLDAFNICNPSIIPCTDSNCSECNNDPSTCNACKTVEGWYLDNSVNACRHQSLTPKFTSRSGPDLQAGIVKLCEQSFCLNCSANYQICTECDQANGYVLVNGTCHKLTIITTAVKPTKADVDLSWKQQIADTPIQVNTSKVYKTLIANKVKYKLTATDNSDLGSYSFTIENYDQHVILDFTMPKGLPKEQYNVTLVGFDLNMTDGSDTYLIHVLSESTLLITHSKEEDESVKQQAQAVSSLTTTVGSTDSPAGLAVVGALMAADPTGSFFRFTKILQIVNKLYFININYGKRLEAFLAKSSTKTDYEPEIIRPQAVFNRKETRGKLTNKKVTLSGISMPLMMYKIIFYVLSWLLRGVKRLLIDNCIMGKVGIYFCHYANKVHLIIFNLVFIDFIWLAPRTLMHSRGLSNSVFYSTIFVMCLIAADLCLLLAHLLDDRIWRKALEHYTSLQEFVPAPDPSSKEKKNDSSMNALKKPDQPSEQDGPNQPQTKQINYKRTYFEIDFNVHLMDMATNTLTLKPDAVGSTTVRLLVAQLWMRTPFYNMIILTTQYANGLGLTVMLSIELCKLFATIYAYLKYKYLKNIICLLMEVSQAICLVVFLFNALLISPKRFDEIILDFYQDAGIWIVIASCVAEYLLLLTYIGVAAYDFFKNRKMMKKMNVQRRTYAFLKFDESHRDVGNRLQVARAGAAKPPRWVTNYNFGVKSAAIPEPTRVAKVTSRVAPPSSDSRDVLTDRDTPPGPGSSAKRRFLVPRFHRRQQK